VPVQQKSWRIFSGYRFDRRHNRGTAPAQSGAFVYSPVENRDGLWSWAATFFLH
jgi:hypothetical protein